MDMTTRFLTGVSQPFKTEFIPKKVLQHAAPKKDLYIFLPYLGKLLLSARSKKFLESRID